MSRVEAINIYHPYIIIKKEIKKRVVLPILMLNRETMNKVQNTEVIVQTSRMFILLTKVQNTMEIQSKINCI